MKTNNREKISNTLSSTSIQSELPPIYSSTRKEYAVNEFASIHAILNHHNKDNTSSTIYNKIMPPLKMPLNT